MAHNSHYMPHLVDYRINLFGLNFIIGTLMQEMTFCRPGILGEPHQMPRTLRASTSCVVCLSFRICLAHLNLLPLLYPSQFFVFVLYINSCGKKYINHPFYKLLLLALMGRQVASAYARLVRGPCTKMVVSCLCCLTRLKAWEIQLCTCVH